MKREWIPLGMLAFLLEACQTPGQHVSRQEPPNILIAIADDLSYPDMSAYGTTGIHTPGFDFVAKKGLYFNQAYACSPGSSPSRASLLTGLFPWQIEEAGTHASSFPQQYLCFPDVFAEQGYLTGYTGKGWGPGNWMVSGREHNPAGPEYNAIHTSPPGKGLSDIDYAANFSAFLDSLSDGQPFCFWYGAKEPHRPYEQGSGSKAGINPGQVRLPDDLPDVDCIREDLADYVYEIEWFDTHLVRILSELERRKLLDNTIVIVTADNGMPFPHAKANCYDAGTHVPLAICWGNKIHHHGIESQLVSLVDILPTLLDLCEICWTADYVLSGKSLYPLLSDHCMLDSGSRMVFAGRERHSSARYANMGYPSRSIRQGRWLLIRNFHPERWPAGDPPVEYNRRPYDGFFDIDSSPTLQFLIDNRSDPAIAPYYQLATAHRSQYELYDVESDPGCRHNLFDQPDHKVIADSLVCRLNRELERSHDSRLGPDPEIWESYPRLAGPSRTFPSPDSK